MQFAWHIPSRNWRYWLDAVATAAPGGTVEVEGDLLLRNPAFRETLDRLGLRAPHVTDLVPASMTRGLFEMPPAPRHTIVRELAALLAAAEAAGVRTVDLDLGLDALPSDSIDSALAARRTMLLECAELAGGFSTLRVCLPIRIPPPYPGCHVREWTTNLFFDTMQNWLQLSFDIFPAEREDRAIADSERFVRDTSLHAAVYRFHWHPDRGEVLPREQSRLFAEALAHRSWRGTLVLRSQLRQTPDHASLVRLIQRASTVWTE